MSDSFSFTDAIRLAEDSQVVPASPESFDRALAAYYLAKELEATS